MPGTKPNLAIGSCPCPIAGCQEATSVHRFKPEHLRDTGRRFAGKLYLKCKRHGRLGVDVTPELQDWILENATISAEAAAAAPADPKPAPPAAPAAKPAPPDPRPGHVPARAAAKPAAPPPADEPKRKPWTFFD